MRMYPRCAAPYPEIQTRKKHEAVTKKTRSSNKIVPEGVQSWLRSFTTRTRLVTVITPSGCTTRAAQV